MAGKITITSSEAAKKFSDRLSAATSAIRSGIERVTEAPGVKAAANKDKWYSKITEAHNSGKWSRRVAAVSLADWQQVTINKGIPRIGAGAAAAVDKMTKFYDKFLPYLQTGLDKIKSMPNVTLEDSINRATAMIRHNAAFVL